MKLQTVTPSHVTYNSILNVTKGQWQLVLQLLQAMPAMRCSPDTISYSLCDDWQWAALLLNAMPARTLRIDSMALRRATAPGWRAASHLLEMGRALFQEESLHTACLATYASALLWQRALISFDAKSKALDLNFLIKSMVRWEDASQALLAMVTRGVQANVVSHNTVLHATSWQLSLVWLKYLSYQVSPDLVTYSTVINTCAEAQQQTCALYFLRRISRTSLRRNLVACNAAMNACKGWHWSLQLLQMMFVARIVIDVVSINTALSSVNTWHGPWHLASHLLSCLPRQGLRADALTSTASAISCGRAALWRCALCTLALGCGDGDTRRQNAVLSACEALGLWWLALQLLPKEITEVSFNTTISACEKGGSWQASLDILHMMPYTLQRPDVISWSSGISAAEKRHRWQVATHLLEAMELVEILPNTISFNSALRATQSSALWHIAVNLFHKVLQCHRTNLISSNAALLACEYGLVWECGNVFEVPVPQHFPRNRFERQT
ncbi:Pentatricopeptide repeat-containing protein At3g04760 [Durusdinium trenchii]|uniref:Chloroplastic n=1 Tax=Durusdinium trenchii TaxID=1381693 RepID=A0ABP0QA57_9DINO